MFVGRTTELQSLDLAYDSGKFQMAVVYGRRRVGKTSLIREFARGKRALFFTAQEQSDSDNLADFSREVARFFGLPSDMRFGSWRAAIDYICEQAERSGSRRCPRSCRSRSTTACRTRSSSWSSVAATRGSWKATSWDTRAPFTEGAPCR